jgi:hypothetical protein
MSCLRSLPCPPSEGAADLRRPRSIRSRCSDRSNHRGRPRRRSLSPQTQVSSQALPRQALHRINPKLRVFVADLLGVPVRRRIERGLGLVHAVEHHDEVARLGRLAEEGRGLAAADDVFAAAVDDRFCCGRHVLLVESLHVRDVELCDDIGGWRGLGMQR